MSGLALQPSAEAAGCFVAVVGPSGAGKDTLIDIARRTLAVEPRFVFPRRLVTRPANRAEDHDTLTPDAFDTGVAEGRFALSWRAHGLGYALPQSVEAALGEGHVVICNLSRAVIPLARDRFAAVRTVLVTAPPDVLAARIAARGREADGASRGRLERQVATDATPDLTIVNTEAPQIGADLLVDFLRALQR